MNARPTGRGNMAARRESTGPASPQTPVGADSISARFAAAQGSAGGINPSPTNHGERSAKREGHTPPGSRRAGCPHPAAPRGGANACGRIWNPPLRPTAGPRPNGQTAALRLYRTSVGDDACTAPAGAFRRPTGPQARLLGRRSSREPRGGARSRGRAMALPYKPWRTPGQTGRARAPRAAVGRDALIPPDPAAAGTPAGGINPSPTNHEGPAAKRANRGPAVISGLCRGRCLHCARRRVSEANRATGPALRPEIVPRGLWRRKVPREGHGPPLQTMANARPNGKGTRPRAAVGRDALIPPHPAAAGTPAGGINPSPTNHGEHPAKWRRPRPLLSQRPGACLFMVLL